MIVDSSLQELIESLIYKVNQNDLLSAELGKSSSIHCLMEKAVTVGNISEVKKFADLTTNILSGHAAILVVFDIIQRIESVMAGMWILSIFFKTAIYFYACVIGAAELLAVRNYRFLVIPIGILSVIFSTIVYPDVA